MHEKKPNAPIKLYALTSTIGLPAILPPVKLASCLPEWWKNLDLYYEPKKPRDPRLKRPFFSRGLTARHCYSMQEVFKRGIGIPLWTDTRVVIDEEGQLEVLGHNKEVPHAGETHSPPQFTGLVSPKEHHFKFVSPWSFVCETAMHFVWTHPFYHQPSAHRFHTMPGIVEYMNQHATNINVVLPREIGTRQEFEFSAGEMMVYIFPMSERRVELIVEEVSGDDILRINASNSVTTRPILFNKKLQIKPWVPKKNWFKMP